MGVVAKLMRLLPNPLFDKVLAGRPRKRRHERAATWESLIHFNLWHRLVREHKLSRASVRGLLVHLLLAVIGPQPAARPNPRPRRTK